MVILSISKKVSTVDFSKKSGLGVGFFFEGARKSYLKRFSVFFVLVDIDPTMACVATPSAIHLYIMEDASNQILGG